jgi:hypothetical protein
VKRVVSDLVAEPPSLKINVRRHHQLFDDFRDGKADEELASLYVSQHTELNARLLFSAPPTRFVKCLVRHMTDLIDFAACNDTYNDKEQEYDKRCNSREKPLANVVASQGCYKSLGEASH